MPRVTVCIPAFRPGPWIAETLQSVQDQEFRDFKVHVAIEPTGDDAFDPDIERRFAMDTRFAFLRNEAILGWPGNVGRLFALVDTEFFVILPHDDCWEPGYLAALVALADRSPNAALIYSDIEGVGERPGHHATRIDNRSLGTRLLSHCLQNANGAIWRGLTRASMIPASGGHPSNPPISFAVECEWSQHMLVRGEAERVRRPLYRKRKFKDGVSVSGRWRRDWGVEERRTALEQHRTRMLAGIPALASGDIDRSIVVLACEIAMLSRIVAIGLNHEITEEQSVRFRALRDEVNGLAPDLAAPLEAFLRRGLDKLRPLPPDLRAFVADANLAKPLVLLDAVRPAARGSA